MAVFVLLRFPVTGLPSSAMTTSFKSAFHL